MRNSVGIVLLALLRGLRRRCPACGRGRIFSSWYTAHSRCPSCKTDFDRLQDHTWAFMYVTTAMLTGLMIVGMFLLVPASLSRGVVLVAGVAVFVIVGTLPFRKGLALAIEWLIEMRWGEGDGRNR